LGEVAATPLKVTNPAVPPKLVPEIVTGVPAGPDVGEMLVIVGGTVNCGPLLDAPPTVTTTGPVDAPEGTVATMLVPLQVETDASTPLNVTVLLP